MLAGSAIEAAMLAPLRVSSHVRPVMRDDSSYSRDQPVNLRQFAPRLDDVTRCRAQAAGHGRERSRPVAAAPASVNKQYWSALFDQLIVQQSRWASFFYLRKRPDAPVLPQLL